MGNKEQNESIVSYRTQQWQQITQTSLKQQKTTPNNFPFKILTHRSIKNLQIEVYPLYFSSINQYQTYVDYYQWRKQIPALVSAHNLDNYLKRDICSTFYSSSICVQRIPFRIEDLSPFNISEGMYIIKCALQGFQEIFKKTGYFQIEQSLFCFNQHGRFKVWMNKNLSKNYPQFNKINQNKNQKDFISDIVQTIQRLIDYNNLSQKFGQYLIKSKIFDNSIHFQDVITLLKIYVKENSIPHINHIKNISLGKQRQQINLKKSLPTLSKVQSLTKLQRQTNHQPINFNQKTAQTFRKSISKNSKFKQKKESLKNIFNDKTQIFVNKFSKFIPTEQVQGNQIRLLDRFTKTQTQKQAFNITNLTQQKSHNLIKKSQFLRKNKSIEYEKFNLNSVRERKDKQFRQEHEEIIYQQTTRPKNGQKKPLNSNNQPFCDLIKLYRNNQ